jgi:hypothetical protein
MIDVIDVLDVMDVTDVIDDFSLLGVPPRQTRL